MHQLERSKKETINKDWSSSFGGSVFWEFSLRAMVFLNGLFHEVCLARAKNSEAHYIVLTYKSCSPSFACFSLSLVC